MFLPAKTKEQLAEKIAAVKAWLFYEPDRYHELRDSYDTTGFRKAVINTQLDIEDQLNKIGVFTVSFSCLPFRYLDEGQEAITITESPYTLKNPTVFQAKPYIKVRYRKTVCQFFSETISVGLHRYRRLHRDRQ